MKKKLLLHNKKDRKIIYSIKKLVNKKFTRKKEKSIYQKLFHKLFIIFFVLLGIRYIISLFRKLHQVNKRKNITKNLKNNNSTKVCLCAIAKRENLYIYYFIQHYKDLGYDHIYIYDNNDINDEKVEDVLKTFIMDGYVTIIDYRGFRGPRQSPQMEAYYDCYEKHNKEYDWLSFFDIDEYLILKPNGIKIQPFIESERYKLCPIVKINWIDYSDNNQIYYENKSLLERFPNASRHKGENLNIKSIMRGGFPYYNLSKTYNPHYLYYGVKSCSSSGKFIRGTYLNIPPDYGFATLNHYFTKTITEYVNKVKKGLATTKIYLGKRILKHFFNLFFALNNKTEEKVKIFNNAFNTSFE